MKSFNTYLFFDGNCRDAVNYQKCLDADLQIAAFSDGPGNFPPETKDRVMHARLAKGEAVIMASDTMLGIPFQLGNNFKVSIDCESAEETERLFNALGENGQVTMPMQETFWAIRFGMLTDQFGINWMLNFNKPTEE